MRYLFGLLATLLLLSACVPTAVRRPPGGRPPGGGQRDGGFLILGTSNANNLYRRSADDFVAEYARNTGCQIQLEAAAWGGRHLIADDRRGGDWNPDSEGEMYDRALRGSRGYVERNGNTWLRGLIWTQGNDLMEINEGVPGFTMDRYFQELEDLLDAFERDYRVPVYLIQAGTQLHEDNALAREFRAREASVCERHPNCYNVAQLTDQIYARAEACTDEACERRYFWDLFVHWGDEAAEMIMLEAARNMAELAPPGATCFGASR
jgi:hypothetical protein